jgi:hypothetical protein
MFDAEFVVPVCLLEKGEVSLKAIFSFPSFNCKLHLGDVRRQFEEFPIAKAYVVIGFAFEKVNTFGFKGGI